MIIRALFAAFLFGLNAPTFAVDGCAVLICLTGNWRKVEACVPEVKATFRRLARGRSFPRCNLSGGSANAASDSTSGPDVRGAPSSSAAHVFASEGNCPKQYLVPLEPLDGVERWRCLFDGVIKVQVDGAAWTETWWSGAGSSVTKYSPAAKAEMGLSKTQFDVDFDAWRARQLADESTKSGRGQ